MSKGGDDAQEGYSQEEAKGASELADQRVDGKDQDLVEKKLSKVDWLLLEMKFAVVSNSLKLTVFQQANLLRS